MDYRLFHGIYEFVLRHEWIGRVLNGVETVSVPLIAVATVALWLFARPGGERKWKLASASALAASAVALLANQLIAKAWHRPRPYEAHVLPHPWAHSHDPSFPSDHVSAAFAIAFAVFLFDRVVGSLFLAAAVVIGVGRVLIGAHYPGDVLAGCLVGLAVALLVVRVGRPAIALLVRVAERVTDPVLRPVWRRVAER